MAEARNKAERTQRIQWLSEGVLSRHLSPDLARATHEDEAEKRLYAEFIAARRTAEAASLFAHVGGEDGGRYPLTGVGDVNTYALFAETILQIHARDGRAGFIVPTGIATDDSTKLFFGQLIQQQRLASMFGFWEIRRLFPGTDSRDSFCLLTLGSAPQANFIFHAKELADLSDERRRFSLTRDHFRLINPNTLTCPIFRSARDAELTKKLYSAAQVLMKDAEVAGDGKDSRVLTPAVNPWGISFMRMLDMANDSNLFSNGPAPDRLPLYEAKLIHQFDHQWATYTTDGNSRDMTPNEKQDPQTLVTPRYWVSKVEVEQRLQDKGWTRGWLMGWRDICRATDERTVIASVIPRVGVNHKTPLYFVQPTLSVAHSAALLANFDSLVLDYVARQKVGGTSLSYFYLKQLPFLEPERYAKADLAFIVTRVLELTYTAHDLSDWAKDLGYEGAPFAFDLDRRAILRAELDAYYARLYGLTRDELRYILDPADIMGKDYPSETFRVLKNNERIPGTEQYRTQQLVLAAWDALEVPHPITAPEPKPVRRRAPLPIYAEGGTPASAAEDWLAGLIVDVLQQAGPCDDNQLRRILGAQLPDKTPDAEVLHAWLAPVNTDRWGHICSWLRALLGVPVTAPLSIRDAQAQAEVLGDHRTEALARALIAARRQQEAALAEALAGSTSEVRPDEIRKQG